MKAELSVDQRLLTGFLAKRKMTLQTQRSNTQRSDQREFLEKSFNVQFKQRKFEAIDKSIRGDIKHIKFWEI